MDSIYHIDTDIECQVLHYGKEVCIAKPGEDTSITLRKGRHKLSFVSVENSSDQYSTMFVVPENDIEDCIEVVLTPYRDERLAKEEEVKRRIREQARIRLCKLLGPIFRKAQAFDENNWMRFIDKDSSLFPAYVEGFANKHYVDLNGSIVISTDYYARFLFHEGVACVGNISYYHMTYDSKFVGVSLIPVYNVGFINQTGTQIIPCVWKIDRALGLMGVFSQDRAFVLQNDSSIKDELVLDDYYHYDNYIKAGSEMTVVDEGNRRGRVQYPSIRGNRYFLINKQGEIQKQILNIKGLIPHFYPFRQGLSVILWTRVEEGANPYFAKKHYISLVEVVDWSGNVVIRCDDIPARLELDDSAVSVFIEEYAYIGQIDWDDPYYLSIESGLPTIVSMKNSVKPNMMVQSAVSWYYPNLFRDYRWSRLQFERKISKYDQLKRYRDIEMLSEDREYRLSRYSQCKPVYLPKLLALDDGV